MKRLGTFSGVFTPSFEAILGAVLFLILPMLTGLMGVWKMALIVIVANTVTVATGFSIADCTTNLVHVGAGGMYAISRASLGKAFGGSIGIQLYLAQSASIGFYAIGFAEPLQGLLANIPFIHGVIGHFPVLVQKQILATILAVIAFVVGIAGANFVVKIQMLIFVVLIVSVGSIILSPLLGLGGRGAALYTSNVNIGGNPALMGFWVAFAAFFPAVTGIDAGVGMSGSLENPRRSLPAGTFAAIGVTFVVYLGIAVIFSFIQPELLYSVGADGRPVAVPAMQIFSQYPVVSQLLLVGILVATCSSALAYFLTAPATAQALARDNVLPGFLSFLGRDFKRGGSEPRWATVLTLFLVVPVIWSGDVTTASTVVGICFLVVYGWVNLAAFLERVSRNPSFRPTFKGHWIISFYGFAVCMIVISLFNIWVGLGALASQLVIFSLLLRYKSRNRLEGVWWGVLFSIMNWGYKRIRRIIQGTKNWRPIVGIFCMADRPEDSQTTFEMGRRIADYLGLTMVNVLKPKKLEKPLFDLPDGANLIEVENDNFHAAITAIIQAATPGGFQINTTLLPLDPRLNHIKTLEFIIRKSRNVLLYSFGRRGDGTDSAPPPGEGALSAEPLSGSHARSLSETHAKPLAGPLSEAQPPGADAAVSRRLDVWWKGEENGSLMALLAYMISSTDAKMGLPPREIRIIRKLFKGEDDKKAEIELKRLFEKARLRGEFLILPEDDRPIDETIRLHSSDAYLVLMGMPGERTGGLARLFALDRYFFTRQIEKFDSLPPVLFVKAHDVMNLFDPT